MGLVSPSQSAPGETIEAADVNTPVNQLAAVINGNIETANLADGSVTTAKLAATWQVWPTITWTNVTIGNAVVTARYIQVGKIIVARLNVVWGNTTSASGAIRFSLPVTAAAYAGTTNVGYVGFGTMYDVSGAQVYDTNVTLTSSTTAGIIAKAANGTWVTNATATNAAPVTWANTDEWDWLLIYEAV